MRWIREHLDLTQSDLAKMIGASTATVQSIELGRLALAERFAYRLQQRLGLSAKALLDNDWENLPDPKQLRENFEHHWLGGGFDQSYPDLSAMRLNFLRDYLLLRAVVAELGYHGCNSSGFNKILRKAHFDLLGTISDKKLRERIYQKFIDETGDALGVLKAVVNDCRDLRAMLTEGDRKKAQKREASPFLDPDKVTFRWDSQKRTVQHADEETGQLLPESEVLKPGYTYQTTQGLKPPPRVPKDWLGYWKPGQPAVAYYDVTGKAVQFTLLTD